MLIKDSLEKINGVVVEFSSNKWEIDWTDGVKTWRGTLTELQRKEIVIFGDRHPKRYWLSNE